MKKTIRIVIVVLLIIFGLFKFTEWYLEWRFEKLINKNPDRAYNITYNNFDLHTFFKGITLDKVEISPLNKTKGTLINGKVDYAELNGFVWTKFLFANSVKVNELQFVSPEFEINIVADSTTKEKSEENSLQNLFSDILSRADLDDFQISEGTITITENDSILKGQVHNINISATEIETDSVKLTHIIPFQLGNLEVELDSMSYQLNDYTKAKLGTFNYSIADNSILVKDVSLLYDKDWVDISKERGLQDDVIEFKLGTLKISGMSFSSGFWSQLDIKARKMEIDSLSLGLRRNKNLQRPPDVEKPLFKGLVDKIPNKVDLDSIIIRNSAIGYGELSVHKQHTGVIEINEIDGFITQFTTFPEQQRNYGSFEAHFNSKLNGAGTMGVHFSIPYEKEAFSLHTTLGPMNMTELNSSLVPLLGVEFKEGSLHGLDFRMEAGYYQSQNHLAMDYENFHLTIYKEADDGSQHKQGFLSAIANTAIRHHNLPEDKHYIQAYYETPRNIYRSLFQHIVAGVLDGAKHIVPGKGVQSLINKDSKKKKKK